MESIGTTEIILIVIILGIPLILIAAIISVVVILSKKRQNNLKQCPHCAEMIQPEAIVCRHCGRDLVK